MTSLEEYWKKRYFDKTKEPRGKVIKKRRGRPIFVVQEHFATRHHFDMRLEIKGVLKSWAVPKGPPTKIGIKRLAIQVEDHPLEYATFHGVIPPGLYGAGPVKIWDKGTHQMLQPAQKKLVFVLKGKKLKGEYTLLLFRPPQNWLLFKNK